MRPDEKKLEELMAELAPLTKLMKDDDDDADDDYYDGHDDDDDVDDDDDRKDDDDDNYDDDVPQSGRITGILMQMREDMAKGLAEETADEEGALKSYSELMAAKEQVVLVLSKAIGT